MIYDPDKGVPSMLEMLDGKPPATTPPVRVESEPGKKYAYANGGCLILELLITDLRVSVSQSHERVGVDAYRNEPQHL